jgi:uncharacterized integral membrane protein
MEVRFGPEVDQMRNILYIALVILAIIILIQNTAVVTMRLLFWKTAMSQAILAFLLLVIGFGIGFLTGKLRGKLF